VEQFFAGESVLSSITYRYDASCSFQQSKIGHAPDPPLRSADAAREPVSSEAATIDVRALCYPRLGAEYGAFPFRLNTVSSVHDYSNGGIATKSGPYGDAPGK
jgi:hypothetical protein